MGIRSGESGKLFGYNLNFDLSSNTLLELKITNPSGVETAILSNRITAPSTSRVFDEAGTDVTYNADEYMQFTIEATDFTEHGPWQIEGRYTNTATNPDQVYHGGSVSFTVGEDY